MLIYVLFSDKNIIENDWSSVQTVVGSLTMINNETKPTMRYRQVTWTSCNKQDVIYSLTIKMKCLYDIPTPMVAAPLTHPLLSSFKRTDFNID